MWFILESLQIYFYLIYLQVDKILKHPCRAKWWGIMAECASIPSESEDEERAMPDLSHFSIRKQTSYRLACYSQNLSIKKSVTWQLATCSKWTLWIENVLEREREKFFLLWAMKIKAISVEFRLTYTEQDTYAWLNYQYTCINMYIVLFDWIYKKLSLNEYHEKIC